MQIRRRWNGLRSQERRCSVVAATGAAGDRSFQNGGRRGFQRAIERKGSALSPRNGL